MKKRSDDPEDRAALRDRVIGLGERSFRKNYYPQLRQNLASLERFRTLLDHSTDLILLVALPQQTIVDANAAVQQYLALEREALVGATLAEVGLGAAASLLEGLSQTGAPDQSGELRLDLSGCGERMLELTLRTAQLEGQRYAVAVGRDVTRRHRAECEVRKLSEVVEQSPAAVVVTDAAGCIEYVNRRFTEMTGYTAEEVSGKRLAAFEAEHAAPVLDATLWTETADDCWHGEFLNRSRNGERYWEHQRISPIRDPEGRIAHFVAVKEDITHRKQAAQKIEHLALHDSLTDLPNRAFFQQRLEEWLHRARTGEAAGALFFLDLDDFKDVNDSLGHHAGDAVLQGTARRLRQCVRDRDFIARLGGDEFAVIAPEVHTPEAACELVERILAGLLAPHRLEEMDVSVGVSIGIALFPTDGSAAAELLRNADLALYRAKGEGNGRYCFYRADMDAEVLRQRLIARELRRAAERRELRLNYQPIVDLRSGRLTGLEALLRWHHAERGSVPPAYFVPIAEQTRLIVPIGDWVLHEVCRQIGEWDAMGLPPVPVAVNLSAVQFRHADLPRAVSEALEAGGVAARRIHLEITESVAMHNSEEVFDTLTALRARGLEISLDDFGTGYSSLSHLNRLPIDRLKIDRSFLRDVHQNEGQAMVDAIVALARVLGKQVIAEGIENAVQLDYLRTLGPMDGQGHFFSRPLPAEACAAVLARGALPQ